MSRASASGYLSHDLPFPDGAHDAAARVLTSRPSARGIMLLLNCFLLPVSLIPASWGSSFQIPPLPYLWWTDNVLLVFVALVMGFRLVFGSAARVSRSTKRWFLLPLFALGCWQLVSVAWNGRDGFMRWYSVAQTLLMGSAVLSGILLASGLALGERLRLARWLVVSVGGVVAVYVGLSVVFPTWRPSYDSVDLSTKGLGFIRVFGPLGTSTTLNFMLLPVLGVCVGMLFLPQTWKLIWGGISLFILACIVLTGSRGGLVSFAAFCVLLLLSLRLRSILYLAPVGVILASIILFTGVPDRFRNLEDRSRLQTYETAFRAWSAHPWNWAFGTGHGALYSKLHDDSLRHIQGRDRWFLLDQQTSFGYTLRNSHSTVFRSLAETGIIGFVLQCIPLVWLLSRLLLPRPGGREPRALFARSVLAGCTAMIAFMMAEEFFISAFWIVLLWTMFTVIGVESIERKMEVIWVPAYVNRRSNCVL